MAKVIQQIDEPEIFIGIVAPIGTEIEETMASLEEQLERFGYDTVRIRVTECFKKLEGHLDFDGKLNNSTVDLKYETYIKFGDDLRRKFEDNSVMSYIAIDRIFRERETKFGPSVNERPRKVAYIIRQFKRKEEIDLLRTTYGSLFFQLSVYSMRSSRVDSLARQIANSRDFADPNRYRHKAEELVRIDETESEDDHGQRVSDVFHDADFIINTDINEPSIYEQTKRFVNLLFGANFISPTKMEYGMYIAKSASLRTLDLSRQVGAAIFSKKGEVISLGTNEVPKGRGGTYWSDDKSDDRDYKRRKDSNRKRKEEILSELVKVLKLKQDVKELLKDESIKKSQFMDALEYGRIIHAEMSAICDSARLGRELENSVLYCTTFPCHMCAKHIVAAGISEVIFLEPYPKSLASELHGDSIDIEGHSRGGYSENPSTAFRHFYGVSPRRYRDLFERGGRKDKLGNFERWKDGIRRPIVNVRLFPQYLQFETHALKSVFYSQLGEFGIPLEALLDTDTEIASVGDSEPQAAVVTEGEGVQ